MFAWAASGEGRGGGDCLLLCARAARFPQTELVWDKSKLAFTNNDEATKTCVTREYRKGFELPSFA